MIRAIIFFIFLPVLATVAQTVDKKAAIREIRERYKIIAEAKKAGKLMEKTINYNCPGYPEDGDLTFYTDNSGLKLIELTFSGGSHFGGIDQYYVWDGKLFFSFYDQSWWNFDMNDEDYSEDSPPITNTVDNFTEERFYFYNEQPIRCLQKNYEVKSSKRDNPKTENVPNEEVDCVNAKEVLQKFRQIMAIRNVEFQKGDCIWEQ